MATTKTRSDDARDVSRAIRRGLPLVSKSEYHASGMVRGYGTSTRGYRATNINQRDRGTLIDWYAGRGPARGLSEDERAADQDANLDRIAEYLRSLGYTVTEYQAGSSPLSRTLVVKWLG